MKKGRSTYTFQFTCDPNLVNRLVQSYIQSNQYELLQKEGEQFYRAGDAMVEGYRYFNYSISGQTLTIYAWFKGVFGEIPIEQNSLNMMAMAYRNSLNTLFQEINQLNNGGVSMNNNNMNFDPNTGQPIHPNGNKDGVHFDPNTGQPITNNYQEPVSNSVHQFSQTFQNETIKKQEKMCEIGFWLSLLGLLCSFVGITYGVIIYILNFYFASQGLKTRKKGKAIATIILSVVSLLIVIFQLVFA